MMAPSSLAHGGTSTSKDTTMVVGLPPLVTTSTSGPTSLASTSPCAPSETTSEFPPMVLALSFKEVASHQGSLSSLHASVSEAASRQGRPFGLHAVVPEAPIVSIPVL
jgi:hypothetical protein